MRKGRDGGKKTRGGDTSLADKEALSLNIFFDQSTPSMRKGSDKGKNLKIKVAITSLPAVDCPNANCWNAARLCQKNKENRGNYVIDSSRLP